VPQQSRVMWHGGRLKRQARQAAGRGLALAAEHILTESQKIVPIEEGTLGRSGVASVDENKLRGAVSFDTPYAVVQHEDLTLAHDAGRTAKYLERPMNAEKYTVGKIVQREVRRGLD
jgi:hypothetical protein